MARSTKDEVKALMKGLDLLHIKYIHIWVSICISQRMTADGTICLMTRTGTMVISGISGIGMWRG